MSVNWTRRNVIATVIVGIVTVVVSAAIYFLESENREIPTETVESPEASEVSPRVLISSVHVSAVAMDVPAAFELEIQARGISSIPARNVNVVLDFGRAEIEVCGYAPKYLVTNVVGQDKYRREC